MLWSVRVGECFVQVSSVESSLKLDEFLNWGSEKKAWNWFTCWLAWQRVLEVKTSKFRSCPLLTGAPDRILISWLPGRLTWLLCSWVAKPSRLRRQSFTYMVHRCHMPTFILLQIHVWFESRAFFRWWNGRMEYYRFICNFKITNDPNKSQKTKNLQKI